MLHLARNNLAARGLQHPLASEKGTVPWLVQEVLRKELGPHPYSIIFAAQGDGDAVRPTNGASLVPHIMILICSQPKNGPPACPAMDATSSGMLSSVAHPAPLVCHDISHSFPKTIRKNTAIGATLQPFCCQTEVRSHKKQMDQF